MIFNKHLRLEGQHAFLGASKSSWLNYSPETLIERYKNICFGPLCGTASHALAKKLISNKIELTQKDKKLFLLHLMDSGIPRQFIDMNIFNTLVMYVNDSIKNNMVPEQVLFYSDNCFGTADAINFEDDTLSIYDFKTGRILAHIEQLEIYAALFCLEYDVLPGEIKTDLRIYQNGEAFIYNPTAEDIVPIIVKIVTFDSILDKSKREV